MTENGQSDNRDEYHRIMDKAGKLLALRLHTRSELERKLLRYKYDKKAVIEVLDRLSELKALDDERFAEIYLNNLIRFKTLGYYGLKAKLLSRGISSKLAERLLSEQLSLEKEGEIAAKLASKTRTTKEKLAASLSRKGFRSQIISQIASVADLE